MVTFYGLADYRMTGSELGEIVAFYASEQEQSKPCATFSRTSPSGKGSWASSALGGGPSNAGDRGVAPPFVRV
jgi:hypothetical protein